MNRGQKTILVLLSSGEDYSMQKFAGIQRYANRMGWHIQMVGYSERDGGAYRIERSPLGSGVAGLLEFWHPAGCIVDCGRFPEAINSSEFGDCPTVFLDHHPKSSRGRTGYVFSDVESVAALAARELMYSGYGNYAYFPFVEDLDWSRGRGAAFARYIGINRKRMCKVSYPKGVALDHGLHEAISARLSKLPKPCGIFAANDLIAEAVLVACTRLGISVPDEVAVVGVDNATYICENCQPTISSVSRDFDNAGWIAAELLDDLMAHPRKRTATARYKAYGVTRRASSRFVAGGDRRVAKAMEYIRKHACERIVPMDVVREMGCSRRLADMLFKKVTGHTLHDEIHATRLNRVKELLRNPKIDVSALPDLCGYASLVDLRRVFKRLTGMTVREYQKRG